MVCTLPLVTRVRLNYYLQLRPSDIGKNVAEFLTGTSGKQLQTVKEAWFRGMDELYYLQPGSLNPIELRVIGEDEACGGDYIWGKGTGPVQYVTVDDYYYSWPHTCEED